MTTFLIPELTVLDYKESLEFYTQLAGFSIVYERPEERFAMLQREGAKLMIEELSSRSWLVGKIERPLGRGINFQIEVQDVDSLYQRFIENGHPIFMKIEEKWYKTGKIKTGHRQFLVQDLDGYLLRFYKPIGVTE